MRLRPQALTWLYRKLGRLYPRTYLAVELLTAFPVTAGAFVLFSFYYEGAFSDFALLFGIACALTAVAILVGLRKTAPLLRPIDRWIDGERGDASTAEAWAAAVSFPLKMIRSVAVVPIVIVVVPISIAWVLVLDLSWLAMIPVFVGGLVSLGYSTMLHYLALEIGMRPVLIDINRHVSPRLEVGVWALPLRWRLLLALPLINLITGLTVAALTSNGGGGADLGLDVAIAVGVATTVALELTILLSKSIVRPIADLRSATAELARGRFDVSVPVTTGDELGELAASFNQMARGLAERERIREAFGTYLDQEVAEYILSEGFSEDGITVEVSILFCDVRDFTSFAAGADATEVVAALNALFEVVVPIVARHGGHVDKFEGDGLLAVFGAPEPHRDHPDRAVRAACEIAGRVNHRAEAGELRVGVGVNSGSVVAGAVGGGGRLNFSVIGDAVNVAARVEAATRDLEEDVLVSATTVARLGDTVEARSVGSHELKGLDAPLELFVPAFTDAPLAADGEDRFAAGGSLGSPVGAGATARPRSAGGR